MHAADVVSLGIPRIFFHRNILSGCLITSVSTVQRLLLRAPHMACKYAKEQTDPTTYLVIYAYVLSGPLQTHDSRDESLGVPVTLDIERKECI